MTALWNPAQYDKFKAQRSAPFYDLLNLIETDKMDIAIDLGCGTGELTRKLFDHLKPAQLIGIDSSKQMLAKSVDWAAPGLSYELGDIAAFQPDAPLDLLFSNAALQWVANHEWLIPNLLSWIKPGGQVAIQVPFNFDHPSHQIAARVATELFPTIFPGNKHSLPATLAVDRYAELLFMNGFAQQKCSVQVYGHLLPSGADVVEWTKGTLLTAYQQQLSVDQFVLFTSTYHRELVNTIGAGSYFYAFKRILIWGRKDE